MMKPTSDPSFSRTDARASGQDDLLRLARTSIDEGPPGPARGRGALEGMTSSRRDSLSGARSRDPGDPAEGARPASTRFHDLLEDRVRHAEPAGARREDTSAAAMKSGADTVPGRRPSLGPAPDKASEASPKRRERTAKAVDDQGAPGPHASAKENVTAGGDERRAAPATGPDGTGSAGAAQPPGAGSAQDSTQAEGKQSATEEGALQMGYVPDRVAEGAVIACFAVTGAQVERVTFAGITLAGIESGAAQAAPDAANSETASKAGPDTRGSSIEPTQPAPLPRAAGAASSEAALMKVGPDTQGSSIEPTQPAPLPRAAGAASSEAALMKVGPDAPGSPTEPTQAVRFPKEAGSPGSTDSPAAKAAELAGSDRSLGTSEAGEPGAGSVKIVVAATASPTAASSGLAAPHAQGSGEGTGSPGEALPLGAHLVGAETQVAGTKDVSSQKAHGAAAVDSDGKAQDFKGPVETAPAGKASLRPTTDGKASQAGKVGEDGATVSSGSSGEVGRVESPTACGVPTAQGVTKPDSPVLAQAATQVAPAPHKVLSKEPGAAAVPQDQALVGTGHASAVAAHGKTDVDSAGSALSADREGTSSGEKGDPAGRDVPADPRSAVSSEAGKGVVTQPGTASPHPLKAGVEPGRAAEPAPPQSPLPSPFSGGARSDDDPARAGSPSTTVRMVVDSPDSGPVRIQVRVQGESVRTDLLAPDAPVRELLSLGEASLRGGLQARGLNLDGFQVATGTDSALSGAGHGNAGTGEPGHGGAGDGEPTERSPSGTGAEPGTDAGPRSARGMLRRSSTRAHKGRLDVVV